MDTLPLTALSLPAAYGSGNFFLVWPELFILILDISTLLLS